MAAARKKVKENKEKSAGTQNFFATLSEEVIKAVKRVALDDDRGASEIFEEAAREWFGCRRKSKDSKAVAGYTSLPGPTRNFFATLSSDIVKAMKVTAIDEDTSASAILEAAAVEWLERRKSKVA